MTASRNDRGPGRVSWWPGSHQDQTTDPGDTEDQHTESVTVLGPTSHRGLRRHQPRPRRPAWTPVVVENPPHTDTTNDADPHGALVEAEATPVAPGERRPVPARGPVPAPAVAAGRGGLTATLVGSLAEEVAAAEAAGRPRALRVRGWAGRGPVGLVAVKPPRLVRQRQARPGFWRGLGRWLSGGEWGGRPETNATWWRFATKAYAWSDRLPARWWAYPRVARAVLRWAGAAATTGGGWAWWTHPEVTSAAVGGAGWVVLAGSGWAAADSLLAWPHRWRWVWPTQQVVAPILGYPERTPPRRFLFIPRGFARAGGQVEVALPPAWVHTAGDETAKQLVVGLRKVLSLADVTESWHVAGRNHFLVLAPRFTPPVPGLVRSADPLFVELMGHQPWSAPLLGLGAGGVPAVTDFASEDPHDLVNGQSGSGKSRLLEGMAAQMLRTGWEVVVLDYKFTSLDSLRGLVTYWRWIEEIHTALVALGRECELRNRRAEAASAAGEPKPEFQPMGVFIEEINTTCQLLQLWWDTHRKALGDDDAVAERYGDPGWKISPAKVAIRAGLSMGRERRVHLIAAAQHATTNALGGPEIREQFGQRLMGRATAKAWGMLAPEVAHPPVGVRHRGRWHIVNEGAFTAFQAALWTPADVRAWATGGGAVAWSHGHTQLAVQANPARPVTRAATDSDNSPVVTLKDASQDEGRGLVAMSRHMLNKQRHKDPAFPPPVQRSTRRGDPHLYDPAQLAAYVADWAASRGRTR